MDKKELANIANAGPTAKGIFTVLSQRPREARNGITEFARLKRDLRVCDTPVVPSEFEETFEKLEKAGVGKIIKEKGKPMSFQWTRSMKDISIAAISEDYEAPGKPSRRLMAAASRPANEKEVSVMLGPNRGAHIVVPSDLSHDEAEFLFQTFMSKVTR